MRAYAATSEEDIANGGTGMLLDRSKIHKIRALSSLRVIVIYASVIVHRYAKMGITFVRDD